MKKCKLKIFVIVVLLSSLLIGVSSELMATECGPCYSGWPDCDTYLCTGSQICCGGCIAPCSSCQECDGSSCVSCASVGKDCCGTSCYDSSTQGCCDGSIYDTATQGCCNDTSIYDTSTEVCCGDSVVCATADCCGGEICCGSSDECCTDSGDYCCDDGFTCCQGSCCDPASETPECDGSGTCVECLVDSDCTSPPQKCISNSCVCQDSLVTTIISKTENGDGSTGLGPVEVQWVYGGGFSGEKERICCDPDDTAWTDHKTLNGSIGVSVTLIWDLTSVPNGDENWSIGGAEISLGYTVDCGPFLSGSGDVSMSGVIETCPDDDECNSTTVSVGAEVGVVVDVSGELEVAMDSWLWGEWEIEVGFAVNASISVGGSVTQIAYSADCGEDDTLCAQIGEGVLSASASASAFGWTFSEEVEIILWDGYESADCDA